jgi:hypothetical protein
MKKIGGLIVLALIVSPLSAAVVPVAALKLKAHPEARVRPGETLVLQALVYGDASDENGRTRRVRLAKGGADWTVQASNGGWLSKPFRFQGTESESFYSKQGRGWLDVLIGQAGEVVLQDCVLYTAPEKPGRYEVEARLEGKTASLAIDVDTGAPGRREAEQTSFQAERPQSDPYRPLAEHWAPFIAQETWFEPKADFLARFDFDGDWRGDNNWDNTPRGSSQAYVYYTAMETETHWFLVYDLFHPRDYSDKCVAGTCHENDSEGLILTVRKDGSAFGRLEVMETLAHNNVYSFRADDRVRGNAHEPDGRVEFADGSHPVVFVEAGGHGIYGSDSSHSRYDARGNKFSGGTGVTYAFKGEAARPRQANDRRVRYELLPIFDHWWRRAAENPSGNATFDDYFAYRPAGGRPAARLAEIPAAFRGRKMAANRARPFWGWYDERTLKKGILAQGQWGLDPAWAVTRNLTLPEPVALTYRFNPYLEGGPAVPLQEREPGDGSPDLPGEYYVPARSRDYDPDAPTGRFDVRLQVDGVVEVYVQHDRIGWRVVSGRPPSDRGSEYTQPIPRATFRGFRLEQKDGRGEVRLVEKPSAANGWTAVIRVLDPKGGSDRYHFRLEWRK